MYPDLNYTIINFAFYVLFAFIVYKIKGISIGLYLIVLYCICALSSIFMVNNPYYRDFSLATKLYWEPYIFLFVCLALIIYPLCNIKQSDINLNINNLNRDKVTFFVNILIIVQIVCIILIIPDVITSLSSNDFAATRELVYGGGDKSPFTIIYRYKITRWFCVLLEAIKPYTIFISFYLAFVERSLKKKGFVFFITSVSFSLLRSFVIVSRGEIVFLLLYLFFVLFFFKKEINPKLFKWLAFCGIIAILIFIPFYWSISVSRFGDLANFHLFRYAGESMCNFNGNMYFDLKNTLDLNVYFPILTLGQGVVANTALDKWDIIELQTGVSGQFFYTIIGGFLFCFGKPLTLLICILFNRVYTKISKWHFSTLSSIIPICFIGDIMIRGIFLFPLQGISGNLEILFIFILMYYFRK